jgi:nitric oxide reductase NorE protein
MSVGPPPLNSNTTTNNGTGVQEARPESLLMSVEVATGAAEAPQIKRRHLPGVEGIWVFVAADMTVFGILFACFMAGRHGNQALFGQSRQALNPDFGGVNTLLLLTSSWFVVMAVAAVRGSRLRAAQHWLGGAFLCGVAFMISKVIEYTQKLSSGITLLTNDFFMYYFTLTGIHLVHVVAGNVVLAVMWFRARARSFDPANPTALECGATYWHMVDLLWIMLFPLLYLLR